MKEPLTKSLTLENLTLQFDFHQTIHKHIHILKSYYCSFVNLVFMSPNLTMASSFQSFEHPNCHREMAFAKFERFGTTTKYMYADLIRGTIYTFDWVEAFSLPLIKQFYDFVDVIIN